MFTDLKRTLGESVDCRSVNVGLCLIPSYLTGVSLRFATASVELVSIAILVAECHLGVLLIKMTSLGSPEMVTPLK